MKTSYDMIEEDILAMELPSYLGVGWELYDVRTSGYPDDIQRLTFVWRKKGYQE
jgi:hypothetical protein